MDSILARFKERPFPAVGADFRRAYRNYPDLTARIAGAKPGGTELTGSIADHGFCGRGSRISQNSPSSASSQISAHAVRRLQRLKIRNEKQHHVS